MTITQAAALRALGGTKSARNSILCPGPGHGKRDTSMSVILGPEYPEGFAVHSFAGDDWRECRDYVRDKLGLPEWKPNGHATQAQPVFVARSWVYTDASDEPYHQVNAMSDGTFRQLKYDLDGFVPGEPDLIVPYNLPDVLTDETIWIVRSEAHADLIRDGFGQVATTYPSGLPLPPPGSFLHHLRGRDVRILDAGGALSGEFARVMSEALGEPVYHLPEGFKTLRQYAQTEGSTLDACVSGREPVAVTALTPTPFVWIEPHLIKPREWLYDAHLIRKFVSLTVSPGGLGKSSLALVEAMAMARGSAIFKDAIVHEPEPLRVWYWNGEDPQEETQRRVVSIAKKYGMRPEDFAPRLFTDSGREQAIILGQIIKGEIDLDEDLFLSLEAAMLARKIDVLVIDPFVSSHRMGENDNNAIDAVVKRLGKLADRTNAAIEIVHHVRKPSSSDTETDVNDARGASALLGGVRSARVLNVMSKDIARDALIPDDMRLRHFSITNGKANMSVKSGQAQWRFLDSVCLENQQGFRKADNVGVVTYYELPEEVQDKANLSGAEDAMRLILSQDDTVRHWSGKGPKPQNWIVHRILEELKIHDETKEAPVQRLVMNWLKDEIIVSRSMLVKNNRVTVLTMKEAPFTASNLDDAPF